MKLSTLGMTKHTPDLVTPLHEAWLKTNPDLSYTEEALLFLEQQIRKRGRNREGSFSASSLGSCQRQQQFTFLGMPRTPLRPRQIQVAHNGTWMHLRWQMAGISAGWLSCAEIPIPENDWDLMGTMDGILATGQGLELKSCNSHAFSGVKTFGLKDEHNLQVHTYMLASGIDVFSVIYENKDTQDWYEIVVEQDPKIMQHVKDLTEKQWERAYNKELAPMLKTCEEGIGWQWDWCSYREICPRARWT